MIYSRIHNGQSCSSPSTDIFHDSLSLPSLQLDYLDTLFITMPAVARIRTVRSLSPSLLTSMTHRYLPYQRTSSPSSTDIVSDTGSTSSRDSCSCDRLKSLNISEKVSRPQVRPQTVADKQSASPEPKPRLPPISSMTP